MAFNLHFYLLRLHHSSIAELFHRIWQLCARLHLKVLYLLDGRQLNGFAVERARVKNLRMPDLLPELTNVSANFEKELLPDSDALKSDIRLRWEPARLQLASTFFAWESHRSAAVRSRLSGNAARALILSWIKKNPFPYGDNYRSAMECALRIPVFFYALKQLKYLRSQDRDRILQTINLHARMVANELSLYSSLGNHTITEAVGLIFAGSIYRFERTGRRWLDTGLRILQSEIEHQILEDGGPAEQSLGYHRFVLDLYWLVMDFVHKNSLANLSHWQPKLVKAEAFMSTFQDTIGAFPGIGDSDDGAAVAPGVAPRRNASNSFKGGRITFPASGYSVIKDNRLMFTFDHGPLGMAPFFNHGHADALSITLSKNGQPLIVDTGTYRYNGVTQWRRYFKSTRAHNTVNIDNQDQAVQETGFIWSHPYNIRLTACHQPDGNPFYDAEHSGYARLSDPVRHRRSVLLVGGETFVIRDRFIGKGIHCFQINFHLHPQALVTAEAGRWTVDHEGEKIYMSLCEANFQLIHGQQDPILGWFSSRYGHKEPTHTLSCTRMGNANNVIFTTIICTRAPVFRNWFR